MLHFHLHDDKSDTTINLGTIGSFVANVVAEMKDLNITAKVFTTKGVLVKEIGFAVDRVIQRIRDGA
jgi:hypothetical protein